MPPRRPPPLPKSLFTNDGPLAPGTAPIAPAPSSLHPGKIVDASYAPDRSRTSYGNTKVTDAVHAKDRQSSQDGQDQPRVLAGVPIISFDVKASGEDKSNTLDAGHNGPVQINIDQLAPLVSGSDWDALEDLVSRLSQVGGSSGKASGETGLESLMNKIGEQVATLGMNPEAVEQKPGLLPPALVAHLPSQQLQSSQPYQSYVNHVSSLSLHENVHLLLTPPVLSNVQPENAKPAGTWWTDVEELDRVVRMYVSTALECFGTHRLVFGSTNPATLIEANRAFEIVAPGEWYTSIARQVIAELVAGEGTQAATASMDAVFANNALSIFTAK
ncbi:hypothetical protein FFLO_03728 [Filobasidium floriforme]|uniref:Uncharacterized protein n=1 Tax=Filobasidium floriforme TaxID=5210 RepID=A0A8K0JKR2_9TREE|nr:hypothetical protein FFLO_03728 [Filobasidium floriforme]